MRGRRNPSKSSSQSSSSSQPYNPNRRQCSFCGSSLSVQVCLGISTPANIGRLYLRVRFGLYAPLLADFILSQCNNYNTLRPYGVCGYHIWLSKRTGTSSSHSSTPMSQPDSPERDMEPTGVARKHRILCIWPQCTKGRANRKCDRVMCKQHCVANGGCTHKDHPAPSSPPSPSSQRSNSVPAPSDTPPHAAHRRRASSESAIYGRNPQQVVSTALPPQPTAVPTVVLPKPKYSSHIKDDVFSEQYERLEQDRARERKRSANALDIARREAQHMVVYCWLTVRQSLFKH